MKKTPSLAALLTCILSISLHAEWIPNSHAGRSGDEIVIFRATESSRNTHYFQAEGEGETYMPGGRSKSGERQTSYVILNLTTGEYREIIYLTYFYRDGEGRRVRVRGYFADDSDHSVPALFETGPQDRRNYLVLSLGGTGDGNNFSFFDHTGIRTEISGETLEGRVRLQRIRTELGIVECLAPSLISGKTNYEEHRVFADGRTYRNAEQGRKSLRIDKRRIRDAKDAGADSLATFTDAVIAYLQSRGYEEVE